MVPLVILVGIAKAWKKDVFSGPWPVLPGGTKTSKGAMAPALAGASFLLLSKISRISTSSADVNTNPIFPTMCGKSLKGKQIVKWD